MATQECCQLPPGLHSRTFTTAGTQVCACLRQSHYRSPCASGSCDCAAGVQFLLLGGGALLPVQGPGQQLCRPADNM